MRPTEIVVDFCIELNNDISPMDIIMGKEMLCTP